MLPATRGMPSAVVTRLATNPLRTGCGPSYAHPERRRAWQLRVERVDVGAGRDRRPGREERDPVVGQRGRVGVRRAVRAGVRGDHQEGASGQAGRVRDRLLDPPDEGGDPGDGGGVLRAAPAVAVRDPRRPGQVGDGEGGGRTAGELADEGLHDLAVGGEHRVVGELVAAVVRAVAVGCCRRPCPSCGRRSRGRRRWTGTTSGSRSRAPRRTRWSRSGPLPRGRWSRLSAASRRRARHDVGFTGRPVSMPITLAARLVRSTSLRALRVDVPVALMSARAGAPVAPARWTARDRRPWTARTTTWSAIGGVRGAIVAFAITIGWSVVLRTRSSRNAV